MTFDEDMRRIKKDADETFERIEARAERDFEKRMAFIEKMEQNAEDSRKLSRDTIYKITLLSASVITFSVTLFTLDFINKKINLNQLYSAWTMFLFVIVLGLTILFIDPRLLFAKDWRYSIQDKDEIGGSDIDILIKKFSFLKKVKIWLFVLMSIVHPQNFFFNKSKGSATIKKENAVSSLVLLGYLAKTRIFIFWLENIFFLLFILSLLAFIKSVKI